MTDNQQKKQGMQMPNRSIKGNKQMTDKQKRNMYITTDNWKKKKGMQMTEKQRNKKEHVDD